MSPEIIFEPKDFKEAAENLQSSRQLILSRMTWMLRSVSKILIGGGKGSGPLGQATPGGATRKLRNSTTGQILGHGEDMRLEIRQLARSKKGYQYGMAVIGGTKPHFPPYRELIPWVNVVLGVMGKKANSVAFLVARKISQVGTQPNPYHERILAENTGRIQEVVNETGIKLAADLWKPKGG